MCGIASSPVVPVIHVGSCLIGFEVLTEASMEMADFWVVALCSLVEVYRRSRGPFGLHHQGDEWLIGLMMEAARTSETLVNF
jgi:hypothetical protein